ncbi:MAG: hypothetical protein IT385_19240 [Deltaproteobacteria bacterium]|nr:hypothetical protein [Deltaproteobacteria bacterium]
MKFEDITSIDEPARASFDAMLWHLEELVPFMDNVAEIRTLKIEELPDGRVVTERRWQGTASSVPALIRPFVTKNSLAWMDYATWTPAEWKCEWRIENKHSKYSSCAGINLFEPHPEAPESRTRCVIAGDFSVYGDRLPAIPKFLGLKMAPKIESIILGFMLPNFRSCSAGIAEYLKSKKAPGPTSSAP